MTTITETQALYRWDTLPEVLRIALCSEANADFLWQTCAAENIPEEKIHEVARIAGHVLQGFIHPEDVAKEVAEAIKIDSKTATTIQDALNQRIFVPLRAEIDKVYDPLSKSEIAPTLNTAPKMFQDIGPIKPAPLPVNKMAPAPMPAGTPMAVAGFAAKGPSISDIGWSKQSVGPVVKLDMSGASAAAPAPAAPKPAAPAARPVTPPPTSGAVGEFERLNMMKKAPGAPAAPSGAEPAPMIIHEDTTFKAAGKNDEFRLTRPDAGAEVPMAGARPQPVARAAILELGNTAGSTVPKPPTPPGVVHYTEFQTSLSSVPVTNAGSRNVSQITPPAPAPAAPQPPKPPMPPSQAPQNPQTAQKEQVIVKDFL